MARRFIVHVGAHKTGTSAFQEWAVRNRAALLDAGFLYPVSGATKLGNHAAMVSALGGAIDDEKRSAHLLRMFDKELESQPNAAVILSAELMSTLGFMPKLGQFHHSLAQYSQDATVVLVVRDQIEWRNSCYAQARQMLSRLPRFRDFTRVGKQGPRSGNWNFIEQKYRDAGFAFETLAFDKRVRESGIVAAMAGLPCLAGTADVGDRERLEANPTVGALALLVAEQVRAAVDQNRVLPQSSRVKLASIIAKHADHLPPARFNGFDPELAEQLRASYRDGNDAFAQRHFGMDWHELFPPKTIEYVSCDTLEELGPVERDQIRDIAGRVVIEALETGLLQLSPATPSR